MKVSIVTPVFNDVRVARTLDSILSQQHELEIIVVDAGSTDGMNKGIRHATGEVVGILNADDWYSNPLVTRDVAGAFSGDEDVDACYGDLVYVNEAGRVVRYWEAGDYREAGWYFGWMPPHPTFFVRRRVYERHGMFDLRYPTAADQDFMLRLLFKHKIKVKYLRRVLVNMAPGGNSTKSTRRILQANLEVGRICWDHDPWGMLLVPILKPARKTFQLTSRP